MVFLTNTLPKCGNPNCDKVGFIGFGDSFYCGKCIMILKQKQAEQEKEKQDVLIKECFGNG